MQQESIPLYKPQWNNQRNPDLVQSIELYLLEAGEVPQKIVRIHVKTKCGLTFSFLIGKEGKNGNGTTTMLERVYHFSGGQFENTYQEY